MSTEDVEHNTESKWPGRETSQRRRQSVCAINKIKYCIQQPTKRPVEMDFVGVLFSATKVNRQRQVCALVRRRLSCLVIEPILLPLLLLLIVINNLSHYQLLL